MNKLDAYEAADIMLNDIYQGGIIGETAFNVINQALNSMHEMIVGEENMLREFPEGLRDGR